MLTCENCRQLRVSSHRNVSNLARAENHNVITEAGQVSSTLDVPDQIEKPPYIRKGLLAHIVGKFKGQKQEISIKNESQIRGKISK